MNGLRDSTYFSATDVGRIGELAQWAGAWSRRDRPGVARMLVVAMSGRETMRSAVRNKRCRIAKRLDQLTCANRIP